MEYEMTTDMKTGETTVFFDLTNPQTKKTIRRSIKEGGTNADIMRILVMKNPKAREMFVSVDPDKHPNGGQDLAPTKRDKEIENFTLSLDSILDNIRKHGWIEAKWRDIDKKHFPKLAILPPIVRP